MLQIQRKSPVTVENATLWELHQSILLKEKKKKRSSTRWVCKRMFRIKLNLIITCVLLHHGCENSSNFQQWEHVLGEEKSRNSLRSGTNGAPSQAHKYFWPNMYGTSTPYQLPFKTMTWISLLPSIYNIIFLKGIQLFFHDTNNHIVTNNIPLMIVKHIQ